MFQQTLFVELANGDLLRIGSESFLVLISYGPKVSLRILSTSGGCLDFDATNESDYYHCNSTEAKKVLAGIEAGHLAYEIAQRLDDRASDVHPIMVRQVWMSSRPPKPEPAAEEQPSRKPKRAPDDIVCVAMPESKKP